MSISNHDSLAPTGELDEDFVVDCPWMETVLKNVDVNTEFEKDVLKSRCIDVDLDESESSIFKASVIPPGPDFKKKCNFRFLPGKMFNLQVQYENQMHCQTCIFNQM